MLFFLLFGIGQVDYADIEKSQLFSLTKSTTEFQCDLRYCDEIYLYIQNYLQDWNILKSFYRMLGSLVGQTGLLCRIYDIFVSQHGQSMFVM